MGTYKCENCGRETIRLDGQKDIYCAMCGYGKLLPLITEKDGGSKVPCSDRVMCECSRCHNAFEAWEDLGEMETDICQACDNEEQEHMLWERDEFGARG